MPIPQVVASAPSVPTVSSTVIIGPPAAWVQMTQADFDALAVKDPTILYIIIG